MLTLLIMYLAAVLVLAAGCALLIASAVLVERPAGYLAVSEVLVPLWCLLAGREQRDQLQQILRKREAASPEPPRHCWPDLPLSRFIDILGL